MQVAAVITVSEGVGWGGGIGSGEGGGGVDETVTGDCYSYIKIITKYIMRNFLKIGPGEIAESKIMGMSCCISCGAEVSFYYVSS